MTVSTTYDGNVAIIEIDDGKKNVINLDVLDELGDAWDQAEANAQAVIFKGRPGSFCAGYDIAVMTGDDRAASAELGQKGGRLARRIYGFRRPVVGLSEGHAFTIGALWLAGCDVRIAESGPYKYGMTEVALDVPLSGWALPPIRARIKPEHHEAALLHSTVYAPELACEVGFVDRVVEPGTGFAAALETAHNLAKLPAAAYLETKLALRGGVIDEMHRNFA